MMTVNTLHPQKVCQIGFRRVERTNSRQNSDRTITRELHSNKQSQDSCSSLSFNKILDSYINEWVKDRKKKSDYYQIVLPLLWYWFWSIKVGNENHQLEDEDHFDFTKYEEDFKTMLQSDQSKHVLLDAVVTAYGILKPGSEGRNGKLWQSTKDASQQNINNEVNLKRWLWKDKRKNKRKDKKDQVQLTFQNIQNLGKDKIKDAVQRYSYMSLSYLEYYKSNGSPPHLNLDESPLGGSQPQQPPPQQQQQQLSYHRPPPPCHASNPQTENEATQGHDRQEHPNICTPLVAAPAPKPPPSQTSNSQHGNGGKEGHGNQEHLLPDKAKDSRRRHSLDASTSNDTNSISFDSEVCLKVWEEMIASGEADYDFSFGGGHPPNNAGKTGNGVQQAQQAGTNATVGDPLRGKQHPQHQQTETREVSADSQPADSHSADSQQHYKPQPDQQHQKHPTLQQIQGHQPPSSQSPPTSRGDLKVARPPDAAGDSNPQESPPKKQRIVRGTCSPSRTTKANTARDIIDIQMQIFHVLCCIPLRYFYYPFPDPNKQNKGEDKRFLLRAYTKLQGDHEAGHRFDHANRITTFFEMFEKYLSRDGQIPLPFISQRCQDTSSQVYVLRFQGSPPKKFPLDEETYDSISRELNTFLDGLLEEYDPNEFLQADMWYSSVCIVCCTPEVAMNLLIHSWIESNGRLEVEGTSLVLIDVYSVSRFSYCQRESAPLAEDKSSADSKPENQQYDRLRETVDAVLTTLQNQPTDLLYQDKEGQVSDLTAYKDVENDDFIFLIPKSNDTFGNWVNLDPFYWSSMNQILARQTGGTEPRPEVTAPADVITDSVTWDSLSASSIPVGKKSYTQDTTTTLPSTEGDSTSGKRNSRPPSQVTVVSAPSLPLQITVSAPNMAVVRDELLRRLENKLHPCTTLAIAQVQFRGESLSYYPRILKRKEASKNACYVHNESYRFLCFFMQAGRAADDNTGEVSRRVRFDYGDDLQFIDMSAYVPNKRMKAVEPHPGKVNSETILENKFKTMLGNNSFGSKGDIDVYLVSNYDRKCDGYTLLTTECVAIKRLHWSYVLGHQDEIVNEIQLLATLGDGRHVIQLTEALIDDKNNVYIVTKYCRNGSIFNRIESLPISINPQALIQTREAEARITYGKMLEALDYVHTGKTSSSKGIVHRNIHPDHFLIDDNENVLLTNFAMSGRIPAFDEASVTPLRYTNDKYMLPEMTHLGYKFSPVQADVWACTVILFQILTGEDLYSYPREEDIRFRFFLVCGAIWWNQKEADLYFSNVDHDEYPSITSIYNNSVRFFSPELKILFKNVFKLDPQSRWSIREILESSWMQEAVVIAEHQRHQHQQQSEEPRTTTTAIRTEAAPLLASPKSVDHHHSLSPPSLPRPSLAAAAASPPPEEETPSSPSTPPAANHQSNRRTSFGSHIGSMVESLLSKPIPSIGTIGTITNFDIKDAFPPSPLIDRFLSRQVTPTQAAKVKASTTMAMTNEVGMGNQSAPVSSEPAISGEEYKHWMSKIQESKELSDIQDIFKCAPKHITSNKMIVMAAVKKDGRALRFVPVEYQNNKEVAMFAVKEDPDAIKYVHIHLQRDRDILIAAGMYDDDHQDYFVRKQKQD